MNRCGFVAIEVIALASSIAACDGQTLWPPYAEGISQSVFEGDACEEIVAKVSACPEFNGTTTGFEDCTAESTRLSGECLVESGVDLCALFFHFEQLSPNEQNEVGACFGAPPPPSDDGI